MTLYSSPIFSRGCYVTQDRYDAESRLSCAFKVDSLHWCTAMRSVICVALYCVICIRFFITYSVLLCFSVLTTCKRHAVRCPSNPHSAPRFSSPMTCVRLSVCGLMKFLNKLKEIRTK